MSRLAESNCRRRGFVFNAYGRRRHLPDKVARKAFNSVIQGGAMDLIKERMVACHRDEWLRSMGIRIVANVHDEVLFEAPTELMLNSEVHRRILDLLQSPSVPFSVPIRAGLGVSAKSWAEAAGDDTVLDAEGKPAAGRIV